MVSIISSYTSDSGSPIAARLWPLDLRGSYRIEVPEFEIELTSRYPENRLAKVLDLAGVEGKLQVFDGESGMLRSKWNIHDFASRRSSETRVGFRREPWTKYSLRPLKEAVQKVRQALQDRRNNSNGTQTPEAPESEILAPSANGLDRELA